MLTSSYFQAQYEFYEKFAVGILNHDLSLALQNNCQSRNKDDGSLQKDGLSTEPNIIDIADKEKEEERNNLNDTNVLQYDVPSFNEEKILGA